MLRLDLTQLPVQSHQFFPSVVVRPSLPGKGLPSLMAAWPPPWVMDWAVTPNSH